MAIKQWILLLNAFLILAPVSSCGGGSHSTGTTTTTSSAGPQGMFPYAQGWLGADGAYSVSLGNNKSLWFFDDTFIGRASASSRTQSTGFIHNSVGLSTCSGMNCTFQYYWSGMNTASPGPIFVAPGTDWYWALDDFIYNGTLYVALMQMHAAGTGAFGFAYSGSVLASISNYTAPPSQWNIAYQQLNTGGAVVPGISIAANQGPGGNPDPADPNGANYAYFFAGVGSPPSLALLRIPLTDLSHLARPGNTDWQYLNTSGSWVAWQDSATTLPSDSAQVINPAATEMTVRWQSSTNQWLAVYPVGLTDQAYYALSSSLTSGWGASRSLYTYPEMQTSNANYTPNVFCYAAKEHPEFETAGQLVFTYVCNSTVESDVTKNMNLYHPIVVTQSLPQK
jgi:hypothetical protein